MMMIAFICLVAVCVITGTFYSIYSYKLNTINIAGKFSAILSCGLLAIVTSNLTSAISGYSLFVILGIMLLMFNECTSFIGNKESKGYYYIKNISQAIAFAIFLVAGILYGNFNYWGALFGIFFTIGMICVKLAVNKEKKAKSYWISNTALTLFISLFLGQGASMLFSVSSFYTGMLYLASGACVLIGYSAHLLRKPEQNLIRIIANAFYILGIIAISASIFFM